MNKKIDSNVQPEVVVTPTVASRGILDPELRRYALRLIGCCRQRISRRAGRPYDRSDAEKMVLASANSLCYRYKKLMEGKEGLDRAFRVKTHDIVLALLEKGKEHMMSDRQLQDNFDEVMRLFEGIKVDSPSVAT